MNVFISYRRDDSRHWAERLHDRLEARYGPGCVFKDVGTISPGRPFPREIQEGIDRSQVFLAIVGRDWRGQRSGSVARIDDPADFVRQELERAVSRELYILPILVDGAKALSSNAVPSSLSAFCQLNCAVLRHDPDFDSDVESIVRLIAEYMLLQIAKSLEAGGPSTSFEPGLPDRMSFVSAGLARDENNFDFLIKRAQMSLLHASQPGGSGFLRAIQDYRRALGINKESTDPHVGLGTIYFHLAMSNLVSKDRYRIHSLGKMGKHPVTGELGMSSPDLELALDYPTAECFKLALAELLEGQRLRQGFQRIDESTSYYFTPTDVSARIKSCRILLGFEPMTAPDQYIVQVFTTALMKFDPSAFSKVFEIVGYDDETAPAPAGFSPRESKSEGVARIGRWTRTKRLLSRLLPTRNA